jgi:steroid delta-isomerase
VTRARTRDVRVVRVVAYFEQLQRADLAALDRLYAPQARFKDPFNDVTGLPAIRAVFEHMFATVDAPRFEVRDSLADGERALLTWDFLFRRRGTAHCIHGASVLHFDRDGLIVLHRDYWDAAQELYEKLPLIGALMRWLRRRLRAPAKP